MLKKWNEPFDPDETKNYDRDWSPEMDATSDTIQDATFTVETPNTGLGIVDSSVAGSGKIAIVWFSADNVVALRTMAGRIVIINHTVTTNGGRTLNERIALKILEK